SRTNSKTSLSSSLIPAEDTWGNVAALCGSATAAQWLGSNTGLGRLLGAPVTAMAMTFGMASFGILAPGGTLASKQLQLLALNLATPLILLGADLDQCLERCGSLILSFGVAAVATVIACLVGWRVAGASLQAALGVKDGLAIAAALMAKNIGGGINYIAVCRALQASPQAIAAGLCIDNLAALVYFPVTNAIGSGRSDIVTRSVVAAKDDYDEKDSTNEDKEDNERMDVDNASTSSMTVQSVSTAIFASCSLLWLGERVARAVFQNASAQLPLCTLLTVLLVGGVSTMAAAGMSNKHNRTGAQKRNAQRRKPMLFIQSLQRQLERLRPTCSILGTTCLYWFFSTAGAPGSQVADSVKSSIIPLSKFLACLYGIHGGILWASYKLLWRKDDDEQQRQQQQQQQQQQQSPSSSWRGAFLPQRLLVASSSAIGGPATSVALAESNGWKSLVVPAILVGNIGYVIATFCGLAYYYGLL
ncbi:MAG: hypothetical protein SGARI_001935, partial [Bacillariaceae sp.]